jgi:putative membrane protein
LCSDTEKIDINHLGAFARAVAERQRHREIPSENRASEHLANERTFLAWVRTTIALISLGFVLARIGPWLSESGTQAPHLITKAWPVGHGSRHFWSAAHDAGSLALRRSEPGDRSRSRETDRALVWSVTVAITLVSGVLILYMLLTPAK